MSLSRAVLKRSARGGNLIDAPSAPHPCLLWLSPVETLSYESFLNDRIETQRDSPKSPTI